MRRPTPRRPVRGLAALPQLAARAACIVALSALSTLSSCMTTSRSESPAVPQRPLFTVDVNTVEEGSVQLEAGAILDPSDGFDTPVLGTYGLGPRTQFLLGSSPWVYVDRPGPDGSGPGDIVLGFKHRFREASDELPGFALRFLTKIPTTNPREGISNGEVDFAARAVFTQNYGDYQVSANYELAIRGEQQGEGTDLGHTATIFAARPIDDRWSAFGELLVELRPEEKLESAEIGAGVAWSPRASTVVDAGISIGLDSDAPDLRFFAGVAINFGRAARAR